MTNRQQKVSFKNSFSSSSTIDIGIPQGSILGPLLFAIYINDLPLSIRNVKVDMYADDTTLHVAHKNPQDIQLSLQSAMNDLTVWLERNKLVLNVDKTKIMLIGSAHNLKNIKSDTINVNVNGKMLEIVDSAKMLGVEVDSFLNFNNHVANISKKISCKIGFIRRIKSCIPRHVLSLLFNAIVNPHFEFCSQVWSGASAMNIEKLFKLQKRGLRTICDAKWNEPSEKLFTQLNWVPLPQKFLQNDCIMMFKCMHEMAPPYLCSRFQFFSSRANNIRSTRQQEQNIYDSPNVKQTRTKNLFYLEEAVYGTP